MYSLLDSYCSFGAYEYRLRVQTSEEKWSIQEHSLEADPVRLHADLICRTLARHRAYAVKTIHLQFPNWEEDLLYDSAQAAGLLGLQQHYEHAVRAGEGKLWLEKHAAHVLWCAIGQNPNSTSETDGRNGKILVTHRAQVSETSSKDDTEDVQKKQLVVQLSQKQKEHEEKIAAQADEIEQLRQNMTSQAQLCASLDKQLKATSEENEELRKQIYRLDGRLEAMSKENEELRKQICRLGKLLEERTHAEAAITEHTKSLARINDEIIRCLNTAEIVHGLDTAREGSFMTSFTIKYGQERIPFHPGPLVSSRCSVQHLIDIARAELMKAGKAKLPASIEMFRCDDESISKTSTYSLQAGRLSIHQTVTDGKHEKHFVKHVRRAVIYF